ncbi:MAG: hypothetical protein LBM59_01560 [Ruminococcus sp.]|jgi:hypothetical protein|nr:hypothetical protein [Ruminococcus sp.]
MWYYVNRTKNDSEMQGFRVPKITNNRAMKVQGERFKPEDERQASPMNDVIGVQLIRASAARSQTF